MKKKFCSTVKITIIRHIFKNEYGFESHNSIENNTRKMDTCCLGVILKLVAMVIASCYMYHYRVILSNYNMGFKTIFVFKDVPNNSYLYLKLLDHLIVY
jgi:hypothetical protein